MEMSGEPDKGTEDKSPGRKLVTNGSAFDRPSAQDKQLGIGSTKQRLLPILSKSFIFTHLDIPRSYQFYQFCLNGCRFI